MFILLNGWTLTLRKIVERKPFLPNQGVDMCILMRRIWLSPLIVKSIKIIARINVCLIWQINFDSLENSGKKCFSCQTKASISCMPIRRTWLWCSITKRMKIFTRIHVHPIWWTNFDYMENGGKKCFSCQTKASISCMLMRRTWLWCSIMKRAKIFTRIHVQPIWWMNFDSMENNGKKWFFCHTKASILCIPLGGTWL